MTHHHVKLDAGGPLAPLRVADGQVTHIHLDEDTAPVEHGDRRLDLHGRILLPGLRDAHVHLAEWAPPATGSTSPGPPPRKPWPASSGRSGTALTAMAHIPLISAMLTAPTRLASSVAAFTGSPGTVPSPRGSSTRRTTASRSVYAASSAARSPERAPSRKLQDRHTYMTAGTAGTAAVARRPRRARNAALDPRPSVPGHAAPTAPPRPPATLRKPVN
ncbi:hypothetical protein [Streptomyces sp. NBC_01171]|uniref:hypothetical protein n=1 Tax=Streptomyces sp. NBC_01171 TaxID=2903757 RepID=UPI00386D731F